MFSHFLYGFFLDLFFQMCKTQWELISSAVWGCERNPLLVDHVLENKPSPEQKRPEALGRAPKGSSSPEPGGARCWQSAHVSGPTAGSWVSALFCSAQRRFSPLLHIYYKYLPGACFIFWLLVLLFIYYSRIKTGAKQFTVMRRHMKKFSQVFSLVEWDSTSMVNINTVSFHHGGDTLRYYFPTGWHPLCHGREFRIHYCPSSNLSLHTRPKQTWSPCLCKREFFFTSSFTSHEISHNDSFL